MEFHEKLQELRKHRGLTQEELAEALFVSRTAISKWESGRGYPSIDSLKEISKYFSVTIDDLLSGEKLLFLAEKENKLNIQNICDLLFAIVDICSVLLMILPLYPEAKDSYIYSVNLFAYTEVSFMHRCVYWGMFVSLIVLGLVKLFLIKYKSEKNCKIITDLSMGLHILLVVILAITRESYAIIMAFLLLVTKGILLLKCAKIGN